MGCQVSKREYKIRYYLGFCPKINIFAQRKLLYCIDIASRHQKLDSILGVHVLKIVKNKKYAPKLILLFFFRKIQMILDIENWLWKSDFGTFWQHGTMFTIYKNNIMINILWLCWFWAKIQSNFVSSPWKLDNPPYHTILASTEYGGPERKLVFTARPKIHFHSQIFRYGRSIFCLPHLPNFSDIFILCLHWVSVVRGLEYRKWCRYFSTFIHQCYCRDSNEFLFISIWHLHNGESWAYYSPGHLLFFHCTVV